MKPFRITVFGKEGCDKCTVLNRRIDKLLEDPKWQGFEKQYYSLNSVEGLVAFAKAEVINPQRIPAFQIEKLNSETSSYEKIPESFSEYFDDESGKYKFPTFLGIQTDYSSGGVITPDQIKSVLEAVGEADL